MQEISNRNNQKYIYICVYIRSCNAPFIYLVIGVAESPTRDSDAERARGKRIQLTRDTQIMFEPKQWQQIVHPSTGAPF